MCMRYMVGGWGWHCVVDGGGSCVMVNWWVGVAGVMKVWWVCESGGSE